jgi:phosphatidylglycerophosphate synthase
MNLTPISSSTTGGPDVSAARAPFSYDGIFKLPRAARYFNISVLWIAYYPHVVRLLHALHIRHEVVTVLSLLCGLVAAIILAPAISMAAMLGAALLVHLKDVFDACDGSLARLTGTGHRIGRFLDTIGDGIVFTALIIAVAHNSIGGGEPIAKSVLWAVAAWFSLFLQCSYFNFYHLKYTQLAGAETASRLNESTFENTGAPRHSLFARLFLRLLHGIYQAWFRWQDLLIQRLDRAQIDSIRPRGSTNAADTDQWYGARGFLVANSALCYGTHAFVLILCLLAGRPFWFFPAVAVVMNIYFAGIVVTRQVAFHGAA